MIIIIIIIKTARTFEKNSWQQNVEGILQILTEVWKKQGMTDKTMKATGQWTSCCG
jgi:hypothetical protein